MVILRESFNKAIHLEVDLDQLSSEHLYIWLKALSTEAELRDDMNRTDLGKSHNKTIIYYKGIYICIGKWSLTTIEKWFNVFREELYKRSKINDSAIEDSLNLANTSTMFDSVYRKCERIAAGEDIFSVLK